MAFSKGALLTGFLVVSSLAWGGVRTAYLPSVEELKANYERADALRGNAYMRDLAVSWVGDGGFWYVRQLGPGERTYVWVDTKAAKKSDLFDHVKLAEALGKALGREVKSGALNLQDLVVAGDRKTATFKFGGKSWSLTLASGALLEVKGELEPGPVPQRENGRLSPDRKWRVRVNEGKVEVKAEGSENWKVVSSGDGFTKVEWNPESTRVVGFKILPGDRKKVYSIQSNVKDTTRGVLKEMIYDQPGDKLDTCELYLFNPVDGAELKLGIDPVGAGTHPWAGAPGIRWWKPNGADKARFVWSESMRGNQRTVVYGVDPESAKVDVLVDERSKTFIDNPQEILRLMNGSERLIWRSERDGWAHLYMYDLVNGGAQQITKGEWVVRSVEEVDEAKGEILFTANGMESGDPYFIHAYSIKLDGSGLKRLTEGAGTHSLQWSPEKAYFVDSWSTVVDAPKHVLRDRSGRKVLDLEECVTREIDVLKLPRPEPFVAKGRDGVTDIWGIVYRPSFFDPAKRYPVIEDIYAGPHDSHVPKAWFPIFRNQRLAELGFIVVQIDGMGTSNRGKVFHDMCWKNLKDAGFPDRIAWMKSVAEKVPQMDLDRVGIFGTSAGGQNSTGGVLFHPEFYKVAVSSCGCHDNRIDKTWWNEQWMGYPVDESYAESSNIDNAWRLRGKLMLMVGEIDQNVPPESTYRLCDALMNAGREFELVVLPGQGHTGGGVYGERKRRDFFVRHLMGVEPPNWNDVPGKAPGG